MLHRNPHSKLWIFFTGIIFATIFAVFLLITAIGFLLFRLNRIQIAPEARHIPFVVFVLGSILLGTILALFVGKTMIRPIQNMNDAFDELSRGNFSVKLPTDQKVEEIREVAQRFNAMTHDLSHIETLRSDFVANVSHEFKTPLSVIEGYATLLQNPNLPPEKHSHYTEVILDNVRRLSDLSSSILTLSKLENQELVVDNRDFRLDEQIRASILLLEGKWSAKHIAFDLDLPRQMYYGSEPLLAQVWSNLLDNAIKHSPAGSVIRVTIRTAPNGLTVSIADHGEGMADDVQKHIFEKFYQGDPSRKAEGNGLGLALVKRIVELCRGAVSVQSAPGQGSTFSVTLPL